MCIRDRDIILGSYLSGLVREYTVEPWWSVGYALDTFAQRDGGFEWDVLLRDNAQTGLPELYVELYPVSYTHLDVYKRQL